MLEHVTDTFCYEHATPVKCVFDGLVTIKEYYKWNTIAQVSIVLNRNIADSDLTTYRAVVIYESKSENVRKSQ